MSKFTDEYFGSFYWVPLTFGILFSVASVYGFIIHDAKLSYEPLILVGLSPVLAWLKKGLYSEVKV